ncbi:MFS transporter [Oceanicoccus sp. KOV_DT_Chl]|uniref:MFS transporter n=1 Tax=Oceanicoccus sp. KOV_DT_Chl TaxID=1904639 RepID=UPI000C7D8247|nr:MFS transporter [Oceanicoccus sp. KOV_DT_Chl]
MYGLFVGTRVALVWFMCATVPSSSAYVVDSVPLAQRTAQLSRLGAASQIGTMLGPAFAAFVVFGFLAPLIIHATFTLLMVALVVLFLPESPKLFEQAVVTSRLRYFDPRYRSYILVSLVCFTMLGMVQMTLGFYFEDRLGLSRDEAVMQFSMAMVASSSAMLFSQLVLVQRWRGHPLRLLQGGLPLVCCGYLLIANATQTTFLLSGMALFGFGMGLATPGFMVTPTLVVAPHEQGALAGINSSIPAMGLVFGPLAGGFLYKFSPGSIYWLAAGVIALLWVYSLLLKKPNPYISDTEPSQ